MSDDELLMMMSDGGFISGRISYHPVINWFLVPNTFDKYDTRMIVLFGPKFYDS